MGEGTPWRWIVPASTVAPHRPYRACPMRIRLFPGFRPWALSWRPFRAERGADLRLPPLVRVRLPEFANAPRPHFH